MESNDSQKPPRDTEQIMLETSSSLYNMAMDAARLQYEQLADSYIEASIACADFENMDQHNLQPNRIIGFTTSRRQRGGS